MDVFIQHIQQDIGLRISIVPVSNLIEKFGMAFGNVCIVTLLAFHKFQIDETEIGKRLQIIFDIGSGRTNDINVD